MKKLWVPALLAALMVGVSTNVDASMSSAKPLNGIHTVKVVADGYKYVMPTHISSGFTMFKFVNNGHQLHQMAIVKFSHGKTLADFMSLPPGPPPAWVDFLGGPNSPMPHGGQDEDIVDLKPGHYAAMCFIPGPDGKPHWMNGMYKAFTVMPSKRMTSAPHASLTLDLVDYAFHFTTRPTAGYHIIRVVNKGTQLHEAVFFKLRPGKTGQDILKWIESGMKGPPPGAPIGGITGEASHQVNYLVEDFKKGSYAILCFLPAKDGKMHAQLGMIYNFKI